MPFVPTRGDIGLAINVFSYVNGVRVSVIADEAVVEEWLNDGGQVDARYEGENARNTLVILACRFGQLQLLELLLGRGASVDLQSNAGQTALMNAACFGYTDAVRRLLAQLLLPVLWLLPQGPQQLAVVVPVLPMHRGRHLRLAHRDHLRIPLQIRRRRRRILLPILREQSERRRPSKST